MLRVRATAPGGWLTVAVPGVVLLVEAAPSRTPDAEGLLTALHSSDPVPAALDILMAAGFSAMPAFALLEHRGQSAHYFVRGGVELEFAGSGGPRSASGAGITTWNEQLISGVDGFRVAAAGAGIGSAAKAADSLPLADGAVWADRIEWNLDTEPVASGAPTQAPAASSQAPAASAEAPAASAEAPAASAEAPATAPQPRIEPAASEETLLPPVLDEATIAGPLPVFAAAAAAAAQASEDQGPADAAGTGSAEADAVPGDSLPVPEGTTGYDHLFGVTMMKSVEAAAVRPHEEDEEALAEASAAPSAAPVAGGAGIAQASDDGIGDHDGLTMMSGDIAELRRRAAAASAAATAAQNAAGPASAPQHPTAPDSQFHLELPDGRSEPLDRPVIVGRSPSANKVSGSELPKLVTIGVADPDISRNHVRFTVEGGTVVITDLHSRNGTLMSLPGRPPQKLREGEPTSALAGTIVDLGGGIRITVTETATAAGAAAGH